MLTQQRAEMLTELLSSDPERAKSLLALEPMNALTQINALGYDFTLDELNEFGNALKAIFARDGALDMNSLDGVAGGCLIFDLIMKSRIAPQSLPDAVGW